MPYRLADGQRNQGETMKSLLALSLFTICSVTMASPVLFYSSDEVVIPNWSNFTQAKKISGLSNVEYIGETDDGRRCSYKSIFLEKSEAPDLTYRERNKVIIGLEHNEDEMKYMVFQPFSGGISQTNYGQWFKNEKKFSMYLNLIERSHLAKPSRRGKVVFKKKVDLFLNPNTTLNRVESNWSYPLDEESEFSGENKVSCYFTN